MIPIINSFSTINLPTLLRLSGVSSEDQLLILLEKTYKQGEVSIDQMKGVVRIKSQTDPSDVVKEFLTQIDTILTTEWSINWFDINSNNLQNDRFELIKFMYINKPLIKVERMRASSRQSYVSALDKKKKSLKEASTCWTSSAS